MAQSINGKWYGIRVNQPGYGPRLIGWAATNLDPIAPAQYSDLGNQLCTFCGSGQPGPNNLLAGNGAYISNDLYIDITNYALWLCTAPGTSATAQWNQISGGNGGNGQAFRSMTIYGDYIVGLLWSGTQNLGGPVTIAKPQILRRSFDQDTFDGNVVTYDYTIDTDGTGNYRTATSGSYTETQVMLPRYKPSSLDPNNTQLIWARPTTGTGVPQVDVFPTKWQESDSARAWALQA
jgi:hypothetical protein